MEQKLSVIVPIYNVEPYLRQCLDSIVNQTYRNLEIILIDDGSPDNCGAICDEYASSDERIIVIHKENGGLSAARNDGIVQATGEWLTFVDSDDWCELDYYEQMLMALAQRDVDVVCASGHIWEDNEQVKKVYVSVDWEQIDFGSPKELLPDVLAQRKGPGHRKGTILGLPWDKLYRTAFLREHQLMFDETGKAWEDVLFNFKVFNEARAIKGCTCIGYHYRQVATSIAHGFNPGKPKANYEFIERLYDYIDQHGQEGEVYSAAEAVAFGTIMNSFSCCYYHPGNMNSKENIAKEISEMTNWPIYRAVIHSDDNHLLSSKQIVLKYALRLGRGGVLRVLYKARKAIG